MFVSNPSALIPEMPTIDISEARWAVEYLSLLIEKLGPDSPVTMILRQTRRELTSLAQSPPAIMERASSSVDTSQSGNSGSMPVDLSCCSR